jgi:hypothetical protein
MKKIVILFGAFLLVVAGWLWVRFAGNALPEPSADPLVAGVLVEDPTDDGLAPRALPPVDQTMAVIIEATDYERRIQATINDLPETLDAECAQALERALLTPQDGKDGDFRQHEYALRNFMMDALRAQTNRLPETISSLMDIYQNERQGDVMRGYALQHLCSVFLDNAQTLSSADKQRMVDTFAEALADTSGGTIAGTALVSLHEAARADSGVVSGHTVESAALKLLNASDSGTLSKISAFQICGERKVGSIAQLARETAADETADWVLRMSAVYALGELGQTDGLSPLLNDSDKNVSRAVRIALNAQR